MTISLNSNYTCRLEIELLFRHLLDYKPYFKCQFISLLIESQRTNNEDAWPLWLMRLFPKNIVGTMEAQRGKKEPHRWHPTGPRLKVKCVYAHCNNG